MIFDLLSPPNERSGWPWTESSPPIPPAMPDGSPWPKISIVTPSFNQAQFIEETIRSVLLQGYPNLEYIIIDGGSTDGSVEIIKKYEPWLTYWVSEPDRGQSHAINKGWKRSNGELFSWLNSDDYLAKGALRMIANQQLFCDKRKMGFIHGKAKIISENGQPLFVRGKEFDMLECLRTSNQSVAQSSAFFSSAAVHEVGYLDEDLHMSMDYDLYVLVARNYQTYFIPEILSYFRFTAKSKTSILGANFGPDHVKTLNKIYDDNNCDQDILKVKKEAYFNAHLRSFQGYMRQRNVKAARKEFTKAFLSKPLMCLQKTKGYYLRYLLTGK